MALLAEETTTASADLTSLARPEAVIAVADRLP